MKRELILIFLVLAIGLVSAMTMPSIPTAFYGEVTQNGTFIPDGYHITAKIDGVVSGFASIIDGKYGYGENTLIIESSSQANIIEFYIGDMKIGEAPFVEMSVTRKDFDIESLPSSYQPPVQGFCGDGVCDSGENCLNCPQDCGVCFYCGDGVCNGNETCSSCPQDCGVCPTNGGSSGGGGGSGGGGSSGGVTTISSQQTTTGDSTGEQTLCAENWICNDWTNSEKECGTRICQDTNNCGTFTLIPETQRECPTTSMFGITGGVIGGFSEFATSGAGMLMIFLILIVALLILLTLFKNKSKKPAPEATSVVVVPPTETPKKEVQEETNQKEKEPAKQSKSNNKSNDSVNKKSSEVTNQSPVKETKKTPSTSQKKPVSRTKK